MLAAGVPPSWKLCYLDDRGSGLTLTKEGLFIAQSILFLTHQLDLLTFSVRKGWSLSKTSHLLRICVYVSSINYSNTSLLCWFYARCLWNRVLSSTKNWYTWVWKKSWVPQGGWRASLVKASQVRSGSPRDGTSLPMWPRGPSLPLLVSFVKRI